MCACVWNVIKKRFCRSACRGVFKTSTTVAAFLLPYMVLNVVHHGSDEARREILAEIMAVLDSTAHLYVPPRAPIVVVESSLGDRCVVFVCMSVVFMRMCCLQLECYC